MTLDSPMTTPDAPGASTRPVRHRARPKPRPRALRELRAIYGVARRLPRDDRQILTATDAGRYLAPQLAHLAHEHIGALYLDTRCHPICWRLIGRGTLDTAICSPRDVYQAALLVNAAGVIVAHNHPSNDPSPSPDDRRLWDQLRDAGALIGVECHDAIILTDGPPARIYSMRQGSTLIL